MDIVHQNFQNFIEQIHGAVTIPRAPEYRRLGVEEFFAESAPENISSEQADTQVEACEVLPWPGVPSLAPSLNPQLVRSSHQEAKISVAAAKPVLCEDNTDCFKWHSEMLTAIGAALTQPLAVLDQLIDPTEASFLTSALVSEARERGWEHVPLGPSPREKALFVATVMADYRSNREGAAAVIQSTLWQDLLKERSQSEPSEPKNVTLVLETLLDLKTDSKEPGVGPIFSRIPICLFPQASKISARLQDGCSSMTILVAGSTNSSKLKEKAVSGWAKFSHSRGSNTAFVHLSSTDNGTTVSVPIPDSQVPVLFFCGELCGQIVIQGTFSFNIPTTWESVFEALLASARALTLSHMLGMAAIPSTTVVTFYSAGRLSSPPALTGPNFTKLPQLRAVCRAGTETHWSGLFLEMFKLCELLLGGASFAERYLRGRWLLIWVPALQGESNSMSRKKLEELCKFFTETVSPCRLDAEAMEKELFLLISKDTSVQSIQKELSDADERCVALVDIIESLPSASPQTMYLALTPVLHCNNAFLAPFIGGQKKYIDLIVNRLQLCVTKLLETPATKGVVDSALAKLGVHHTTVKQMVPPTFWSEELTTMCTNDFHCLCYNEIRSTAPGVTIQRSPNGAQHIKATKMGTFPLRSIRSWDASDKSQVYYAEVTIESDGCQRLAVGMCAPNDTITTFPPPGHHYLTFGQGSVIPLQKGDVIGWGIEKDSAIFTLNGYVLFRERSTAVHLLPFALLKTTTSTSFTINFGEAPFNYPIHLKKPSDLVLGALRCHDEDALKAINGLKLKLPHSVRSTLKDIVPELSQEMLDTLGQRCHIDDDFGGELFCAILETGDVEFNALPDVLPQVVQVVPPQESCVSGIWQWTRATADAALIEGNSAVVKTEKEVSHCFGSILPFSDRVSFSVNIRQVGNDSHLLFYGGVYVGVSVVDDVDMVAWKTASPRQVWALHSETNDQLSGAKLPPRCEGLPLISGNSTVIVTLDRVTGTISFEIDDEKYPNVFTGVSKNHSFRPFVQLIGEKSAAFALGFSTRLMSMHSVLDLHNRVMIIRSLLLQPSSSKQTSSWLSDHIEDKTILGVLSRTALGIDPSLVHRVLVGAAAVPVEVLFILAPKVVAVRYANGSLGVVPVEMLSPANKFITLPAPVPNGDGDVSDGIIACVKAIISSIEVCKAVFEKNALENAEASQRSDIQKDCMRKLHSIVVPASLSDVSERNASLLESLFQPPPTPFVHTFSAADSHPDLSIPKHYGGSLILAPMQSTKNTPFLAFGNEPIVADGACNIQVVIDGEWLGLLPFSHCHLGVKNYIGIATESFKGEQRVFDRCHLRDVWAVPALATKEDTLPYCLQPPLGTRNFTSCSRVRMLINRDKGTLEVFVTGLAGAEESLGLMFKDIPRNVPLYPFVQLATVRSSAQFLPTNAILTRTISNNVSHAKILRRSVNGIMCDGCARFSAESSLQAPNWYRCNECSGYDLCQECFAKHVHPGHTFTHMHASCFATSPIALNVSKSNAAKQQAFAEVFALPICPTALEGGHFLEGNLGVQNTAEFCSSIWKVQRRACSKTSFEATLLFSLPPQRICIAVGLASSINLQLPFQKPPKDVVLFDTSNLLAEHLSRDSSAVCDEPTSFKITLSHGNVVVHQGNMVVLDQEVSSKADAILLSYFSVKSISAKFSHRVTNIVQGKLAEYAGTSLRLASSSQSRWCLPAELRDPLCLVEARAMIQCGMRVFIADEDSNGFVPATVTDVTKLESDSVIVHDGVRAREMQATGLWVPASLNAEYIADAHNPFREYKVRLRHFYKKYLPSKTEAEMDKAIEMFSRSAAGLDGMFKALEAKYGPEPPVEVILPPARLTKHIIPSQIVLKMSKMIRGLVKMLSENPDAKNVVQEMAERFAYISSIAPRANLTEDFLIFGPCESERREIFETPEKVEKISDTKTVGGPLEFSLVGESCRLQFRIVISDLTATLHCPTLDAQLTVERSEITEGTEYNFTFSDESQAITFAQICSQKNVYGSSRAQSASHIEVRASCGKTHTELRWWSSAGHFGLGKARGTPTVRAAVPAIAHVPFENRSSDLGKLAQLALDLRRVCNAKPQEQDLMAFPDLIDDVECFSTDELTTLFVSLKEHSDESLEAAVAVMRLARQLWLRQPNDEYLREVIAVLHAHWRSPEVLRTLTKFSEPVLLRQAMAGYLLPLASMFDAHVRNGHRCAKLTGVALDVLSIFDVDTSHLPTGLISLLHDIATSVAEGKNLPLAVDTQLERCWVPSDLSVLGNGLLAGSMASVLPTVKDFYFEVIQPGDARVTVGVKGGRGYVLFDGHNLMTDTRKCTRWGCVRVSAGDVIGCFVRDATITFSVNDIQLPDVILHFEPSSAEVAVDLSTHPIQINSTLQTCRYRPQFAHPLHKMAPLTTISFDASKRSTESTLTLKQNAFIEEAVAVVLPFIDMSQEGFSFSTLRSLKTSLRPEFRLSALARVKDVKKSKRETLKTVTAKWFKLFSTASRTERESLQNSVLSQLHAQLSHLPDFYEQSPMFSTNLAVTDSGHTPIDAGGPYNMLWGFLSEEIMTVESTKPDFHRNPMFVLTDSAKRRVMVPNRLCTYAPHLYHFLGIIMGHMARAKSPLAFDFSPYVWKFLVGDTLTVNDYFNDVDSVLKDQLTDEALADDESTEDNFPGFQALLKEQSKKEADNVSLRKCIASKLLVESLNQQLLPLREGLSKSLGSDVLPFFTWSELERSVCGEPEPTFEQVKSSVNCTIPEPFQAYFWEALEALGSSQWGLFFSFCTGQRRYPLSKKITAIGDRAASHNHLPVASTCFAQVRIPLYPSVEVYKKKLMEAIKSQEMELA